MQTLIKCIGIAVVCTFAAAHAQIVEPRKCSTFDHYRTGAPPGVAGKVTLEARPELQTSVLSPSHHFRIHFDTTGFNTPAMVTASGVRIPGTAAAFVDTVAKIFDSVWTAEVTTFGFAAPPGDQGQGGGDEYDVYLEARTVNDFGLTTWDVNAPLPSQTAAPIYSSYIQMDNDYAGYRTPGIAGAMSTAAHEFHHAIQVGSYGVWPDDLYFYELTAEAMEPTVFPYSKDYINDVRTYFGKIETISLYTPFATYPGYERAIWSVFLIRQYGIDVMRGVWEAIKTERPVPAMKTVLERSGTSLPMAFSEFCYWNYFTGVRADTVKYYPDSKLFPLVAVRATETVSISPIYFQFACNGFGVNYLQTMRGTDTVSFIVANTNMADALGSQSGSFGYQLRVEGSPTGGDAQLGNGIFANFSVSDPANWKYIPLGQSIPAEQKAGVCFPNPFNPAVSSLYIGLNAIQAMQPSQTLSVFSTSYHRVFTGAVGTTTFNGDDLVVWDGRTPQGDYIASGIYIYVLESGTMSTKGKFAVIR